MILLNVVLCRRRRILSVGIQIRADGFDELLVKSSFPAKAAVTVLTVSLRLGVEQLGIEVTAIDPGYHRTKRWP